MASYVFGLGMLILPRFHRQGRLRTRISSLNLQTRLLQRRDSMVPVADLFVHLLHLSLVTLLHGYVTIPWLLLHSASS
jgi:hypothetical protein